eukprot:m.801430 g.801430  ORF g.801430 m.801430 type:complete len:528 (-) comp23359_c0_seq1:379-1962(-)
MGNMSHFTIPSATIPQRHSTMINVVSRAVSDVHDGCNSDEGTPAPPSTWSAPRKCDTLQRSENRLEASEENLPGEKITTTKIQDRKNSIELDTIRAAQIMSSGFSSSEECNKEKDDEEEEHHTSETKDEEHGENGNDSNDDLLYESRDNSSINRPREKRHQTLKRPPSRSGRASSPKVFASPTRYSPHPDKFQQGNQQQRPPQPQHRVLQQHQQPPPIIQMVDQNGQIIGYNSTGLPEHVNSVKPDTRSALSNGVMPVNHPFLTQPAFGGYQIATSAAMAPFAGRQIIHQQALPGAGAMRSNDGGAAAVVSHAVSYPHPMQQSMYTPGNGPFMMFMSPSAQGAPLATVSTPQQYQGQPQHPGVDAFGNRLVQVPGVGPNGSVVWYQPQTQYVPVVQMPMQAAYMAQQEAALQGTSTNRKGSKRKQGNVGVQMQSSAGKSKQTKPRARGHNRKCWLCVAFGKTNEEKSRIQMKWNPAIDKLVWTDGHGDNFCPSLNGRATVEQAAIAKKAWSQARSKRSPYRKYLDAN